MLGLLVFTEVTVSSINSYINVPKLQFDDVCLTQLAFLPVIQFGFVFEFIPKIDNLIWGISIIALCTQSSILFLTFAKQIFAVRTGWGRTPLVSLMIRDGVFAFVAIFGESSSCRVKNWCQICHVSVSRCTCSHAGIYDNAERPSICPVVRFLWVYCMLHALTP